MESNLHWKPTPNVTVHTQYYLMNEGFQQLFSRGVTEHEIMPAVFSETFHKEFEVQQNAKGKRPPTEWRNSNSNISNLETTCWPRNVAAADIAIM